MYPHYLYLRVRKWCAFQVLTVHSTSSLTTYNLVIDEQQLLVERLCSISRNCRRHIAQIAMRIILLLSLVAIIYGLAVHAEDKAAKGPKVTDKVSGFMIK